MGHIRHERDPKFISILQERNKIFRLINSISFKVYFEYMNDWTPFMKNVIYVLGESF